ncbi:MAG: MFS transporter [Planctomycetaceae bacterium]|nr:MFS transporter [Planctomycetaceae bacterium]
MSSPRLSSSVYRIILLVSLAHALVHLLEQSVASMEQVISAAFDLTSVQSGMLGSALRLPYGVGALFAGMLADRFGEKRVLILYLLGSAVTCASFSASNSYGPVSMQMFALGSFASMYHPAGLALLANQTTLEQRARALGMHGVFGSLGIASAPFLAGIVLSFRPQAWQGYYLLLAAFSGGLGVLLYFQLQQTSPTDAQVRRHSKPDSAAPPADETSFHLWPYLALIIGAAFSGIIYGGVLHFLPRYLKESSANDVIQQWTGIRLSGQALGNYAAALALVCGAFGQWTAGRIARSDRLAWQLAIVYALNIPFLVAMAFLSGPGRLVAASLWAFVHFMNQPLYNSLLPEFLPRERRSLGFGFSNMMGFGVGALGPPLVGLFDEWFADYTTSYLAMTAFAVLAAIMPLLLSRRSLTTARKCP